MRAWNLLIPFVVGVCPSTPSSSALSVFDICVTGAVKDPAQMCRCMCQFKKNLEGVLQSEACEEHAVQHSMDFHKHVGTLISKSNCATACPESADIPVYQSPLKDDGSGKCSFTERYRITSSLARCDNQKQIGILLANDIVHEEEAKRSSMQHAKLCQVHCAHAICMTTAHIYNAGTCLLTQKVHAEYDAGMMASKASQISLSCQNECNSPVLDTSAELPSATILKMRMKVHGWQSVNATQQANDAARIADAIGEHYGLLAIPKVVEQVVAPEQKLSESATKLVKEALNANKELTEAKLSVVGNQDQSDLLSQTEQSSANKTPGASESSGESSVDQVPDSSDSNETTEEPAAEETEAGQPTTDSNDATEEPAAKETGAGQTTTDSNETAEEPAAEEMGAGQTTVGDQPSVSPTTGSHEATEESAAEETVAGQTTAGDQSGASPTTDSNETTEETGAGQTKAGDTTVEESSTQESGASEIPEAVGSTQEAIAQNSVVDGTVQLSTIVANVGTSNSLEGEQKDAKASYEQATARLEGFELMSSKAAQVRDIAAQAIDSLREEDAAYKKHLTSLSAKAGWVVTSEQTAFEDTIKQMSDLIVMAEASSDDAQSGISAVVKQQVIAATAIVHAATAEVNQIKKSMSSIVGNLPSSPEEAITVGQQTSLAVLQTEAIAQKVDKYVKIIRNAAAQDSDPEFAIVASQSASEAQNIASEVGNLHSQSLQMVQTVAQEHPEFQKSTETYLGKMKVEINSQQTLLNDINKQSEEALQVIEDSHGEPAQWVVPGSVLLERLTSIVKQVKSSAEQLSAKVAGVKKAQVSVKQDKVRLALLETNLFKPTAEALHARLGAFAEEVRASIDTLRGLITSITVKKEQVAAYLKQISPSESDHQHMESIGQMLTQSLEDSAKLLQTFTLGSEDLVGEVVVQRRLRGQSSFENLAHGIAQPLYFARRLEEVSSASIPQVSENVVELDYPCVSNCEELKKEIEGATVQGLNSVLADAKVKVQVDNVSEEAAQPQEGLSAAVIGGIIGGVLGGVALITLIVMLSVQKCEGQDDGSSGSSDDDGKLGAPVLNIFNQRNYRPINTSMRAW